MKTNLYIPKKINVGFVKRSDTFTGKLGFVIYTDDKGILRQEKSWNNWRDQKIEPKEFDNVPQRNFVFNKDIQRNGHWSSHSKVRIYDSRDFEFEIELSNMMYILMHSDVSKRDIQEECVFAWSGNSLVLLPVNSDEYQNSLIHTKKQGMKFSFKDLVKGHTYSTKNAGNYIYIGYYEWCEETWTSSGGRNWKNTGKKHIFYREQKGYGDRFEVLNADVLCECVNSDVHPEFSNYVESLMKSSHMKKIGIFSVKKGFDKVGYKRTAYENLEVTLIEGVKADFKIRDLDIISKDDQPKLVYPKRDTNRYYSSYYDIPTQKKNLFLSKMKDKEIDFTNYNQLKKFFEDAGFGKLYYTNTEGKKEEVISK